MDKLWRSLIDDWCKPLLKFRVVRMGDADYSGFRKSKSQVDLRM
jgi:hypothetical protein